MLDEEVWWLLSDQSHVVVLSKGRYIFCGEMRVLLCDRGWLDKGAGVYLVLHDRHHCHLLYCIHTFDIIYSCFMMHKTSPS